VILSPFSGSVAGWDWAARELGLGDPVGIELDGDACLTRAAAGLRTIRADVATFPLDHLENVTGLTAGPPCTDFSSAGKRAGLEGDSGPLVWEVWRWAEALRPEWVAAEQVKEVLPIWRETAERLRSIGYSVWCGILDSANYGTPQNRRRAILMASRVRSVAPPEPTHSRTGHAGFFGTTKPWVTMADALGWQGDLDRRQQKDGIPVSLVGGDRPAPCVSTQSGNQWVLRTPGRSYSAPPRIAPVTEPAPTVALGHNLAEWCWERPSTTVQGAPRIAPPGHDDRQWNDSIPVTIWDLLVLQDAPRDYPLVGTQESRSRQVGNAIPRNLAQAVLGAVVGAEQEAVA
jgi:DNA (cytosine-5)-methyltransferase 1